MARSKNPRCVGYLTLKTKIRVIYIPPFLYVNFVFPIFYTNEFVNKVILQESRGRNLSGTRKSILSSKNRGQIGLT